MTLPLKTNKLSELRALAMGLDARNLCYATLVNGSILPRLNVDEHLTRLGYKTGMPDVLIFDYPAENFRGMALYLVGGERTGSSLAHTQDYWIKQLRGRKWLVQVAHSAEHALSMVEDAGL